MDVYWLEQTEADAPSKGDWLTAAETARLDTMRFPKRRTDWRLGRWTAKLAIAAYLNSTADPQFLRTIEIRPDASGAPRVFLDSEPASVAISLSHRAGAAMCAIAASGWALGCDLEVVEPHSHAFVADYFTTAEQAMVAHGSAADRSRLVALLWSCKESTLKALHLGLRVDTRSLEVRTFGVLGLQTEQDSTFVQNSFSALPVFRDGGSWLPWCVRYADSRNFHGWWSQSGHLLRTVVCESDCPPPIELSFPEYHPVTFAVVLSQRVK